MDLSMHSKCNIAALHMQAANVAGAKGPKVAAVLEGGGVVQASRRAGSAEVGNEVAVKAEKCMRGAPSKAEGKARKGGRGAAGMAGFGDLRSMFSKK
jgi:hypothetical protein